MRDGDEARLPETPRWGGTNCGRRHLDELMSNMIVPKHAEPACTPDVLTRRERVVLSHLSDDATLEQIATRLFVTRNTVKSQVRSIYRKIGVSTRADAIAWARRVGLRAAETGA
jgi:DNA-binding CsgD family transcriptional regulator